MVEIPADGEMPLIPLDTTSLSIVNKSTRAVRLALPHLEVLMMTGPGLVLENTPRLTTVCLTDAGVVPEVRAIELTCVRTPLPTVCEPLVLKLVDAPKSVTAYPASVTSLSLVACRHAPPCSHELEIVRQTDMNFAPCTAAVLELTRVTIPGNALAGSPELTLVDMHDITIQGDVDTLTLDRCDNITIEHPVQTLVTNGDILAYMSLAERICLMRPPTDDEELALRASRKGTVPPVLPGAVY